MRINTVKDFRQLIEEVRNKEFHRQFYEGKANPAVFRGQEDESWGLIPQLLRCGHSVSDIKVIEKELLSKFKEALTNAGYEKYFRDGFLNSKKFHSDWLFIQQAQHVGLATRFMDWTLDPKIACFFACLGSIDKDATFYILYPDETWFQADGSGGDYANVDPLLFPDLLLLNPMGHLDKEYHLKFLERFKARQKGRFLVQPITTESMKSLREQPFFDSILQQHIITKEAKEALIKEFGLSKDIVYMEDDPLVQSIHPAIKKIITDLHNMYGLR